MRRKENTFIVEFLSFSPHSLFITSKDCWIPTELWPWQTALKALNLRSNILQRNWNITSLSIWSSSDRYTDCTIVHPSQLKPHKSKGVVEVYLGCKMQDLHQGDDHPLLFLICHPHDPSGLNIITCSDISGS